jgi:hypothetical protein
VVVVRIVMFLIPNHLLYSYYIRMTHSKLCIQQRRLYIFVILLLTQTIEFVTLVIEVADDIVWVTLVQHGNEVSPPLLILLKMVWRREQSAFCPLT